MRLRWSHPAKEAKRQRTESKRAKARRRRAAGILEQVAEITAAANKKKKVGGWRRGSGRKPDWLKRTGLPATTAHDILTNIDVVKVWTSLLTSKDEAIRLQTLIYLTNRQQGMPKQQGDLNIGVEGLMTKFEIQLVAPRHVGADGKPLPDLQWVKAKEQAHLLEGEISTPPEPAPSAAFQPPPPPPEPTGNCRFHGDFLLKDSGGREICPQCKRDAERQESYLRGLMPAGGRQ
jgi:hypothetical protein